MIVDILPCTVSIRTEDFDRPNRNGVIRQTQSKTHPDDSAVYQIRITGHLGSEWADWFGGLTITLEDNGETLLTGPVTDQAALHGLLRKVRNLGIPLISSIALSAVRCIP